MSAKGRWQPDRLDVSAGLVVDPKHRAAMGPAVWLYLFLLVHTAPNEDRPFRGRTVYHAQLGALMGALDCPIPERTVRDWIATLRAAGYLETETRARGVRLRIVRRLFWQGGKRRIVDKPLRPPTNGQPHDDDALPGLEWAPDGDPES